MFQMLGLFRVRAARALKREIPNPPYQGGKATEAIRGELACRARLQGLRAPVRLFKRRLLKGVVPLDTT